MVCVVPLFWNISEIMGSGSWSYVLSLLLLGIAVDAETFCMLSIFCWDRLNHFRFMPKTFNWVVCVNVKCPRFPCQMSEIIWHSLLQWSWPLRIAKERTFLHPLLSFVCDQLRSMLVVQSSMKGLLLFVRSKFIQWYICSSYLAISIIIKSIQRD